MLDTEIEQPTTQEFKTKGFKKGNQYGKCNKTTLSDTTLARVNYLIDSGCGYHRIRTKVHVSRDKLNSIGIITHRHKKLRIRDKKCSIENPKVFAYCDLSDITHTSLRIANKRARVLMWGNLSIKLAILTDGSATHIQLTKVASRGERKELWSNILLKAVGIWKDIAVDTNCKFTDTPLNLFHLQKDSTHPYNQVVESQIGNLKDLIYANIEQIKHMDIDTAINRIKELADIQFNNPQIEVYNLTPISAKVLNSELTIKA